MKKDKESIVDFYMRHVRDYREKYGERTIVLLESGHFMELYDYVSEEHSPHLRVCRDILDVIVTRKDKSDPSSVYLAGVPCASIRRYQKMLLKRNYTVVMIHHT